MDYIENAITTILIIIPMMVASYAISSFVLSRIFKKAGVKTSTAWIPIYNAWTMLELGDQKGFWVLLGMVPPLTIVYGVFMLIAMHNIGKKLGKEDWFIIIGVLLTPVWFLWLAFDDSVWNGPKADEQADMPTVPTENTIVAPVNTEPAATPEAPLEMVQPINNPIAMTPVDMSAGNIAPEAPIQPEPEMPTYTVPENPMAAETVAEMPENIEPVYTVPETIQANVPQESAYTVNEVPAQQAAEIPNPVSYGEPQMTETPAEPIDHSIQ